MNGLIPESLGQLFQLVKLDLSATSFKGILTEAHFINLTSLKHLSMTTLEKKPMTLTLNISYDWLPPFKLQKIEISNCPVGPGFGLWLRSQTELSSVTLSSTRISDFIPEEWFLKLSSQIRILVLSYNQLLGRLPSVELAFPNLRTLSLDHNQFEGPFPPWITNATVLDLEGNMFSGPIPSDLGQRMPKLKELYLAENHFNGTIPPSVCNIKDLLIFSLRSNQLSGEFPPQWNLWSTIWVIDVSNNNLSGNIPSLMEAPRFIQVLKMNNNNLSGEIPLSLQNCSELTSIDLGDNKLTGTLPSWLGSHVTKLQMLQLRSNKLAGHIPEELCNLADLRVLDLGHNNFSGTIPKRLDNLTSLVSRNATAAGYYLSYDEQTKITAKGRELLYFGSTVGLLKTIDLSSNNLQGGVPEELCSLVALSTLNLSMNQLAGEIPSKIGNLRWLETLDLSHNNISGRIPQSLSYLTSLSHLNLSYNKLVGRIPSGNQLQTLEDVSIYAGNPSLCGAPLSTACPGDSTPTRQTFTSEDNNKDEDDKGKLWLYVSIILGFVLGFCGVCGTLLIKKSWRYAYFQFFDDIKNKALLAIALRVAHWKRKS